jgi:hypothetical protein
MREVNWFPFSGWLPLIAILSMPVFAQTLNELEDLNKRAGMIRVRIVNLTCMKFATKVVNSEMLPGPCLESGKVFNHDSAAPYHARVQAARDAIKAAMTLGTGGMVVCLGKLQPRHDCLFASIALMNELDGALDRAQGGF